MDVTRSLRLPRLRALLLLAVSTVACGDLQPLRAPVDEPVLRERLQDGAVLFAGQSNAAAPAFTADDQARAQVYNGASLTTWHNSWTGGDSSVGGDTPPGVGLLAGSLGWLLESEFELVVPLLGQPYPGARIDQMLPDSVNYIGLYDRVRDSAAKPTVLLWHQGESDGLAGTSADAYAAMLNELIDAWLLDYPTLSYIVVYLSLPTKPVTLTLRWYARHSGRWLRRARRWCWWIATSSPAPKPMATAVTTPGWGTRSKRGRRCQK